MLLDFECENWKGWPRIDLFISVLEGIKMDKTSMADHAESRNDFEL